MGVGRAPQLVRSLCSSKDGLLSKLFAFTTWRALQALQNKTARWLPIRWMDYRWSAFSMTCLISYELHFKG